MTKSAMNNYHNSFTLCWFVKAQFLCELKCVLTVTMLTTVTLMRTKYPNLCYGFGTAWGWVINDRILIFGWTIPLTLSGITSYAQKPLAHVDTSSFQGHVDCGICHWKLQNMIWHVVTPPVVAGTCRCLSEHNVDGNIHTWRQNNI